MNKPQDCYFAIDNSSPKSIKVLIVDKDFWDEKGEAQCSLDRDYYPDFLNSDELSACDFELEEELEYEEIKEQMVGLGFEYNLELQIFSSEDKDDDEDDEDFDEAESEDDDNFWDIVNPKYVLN